MLIALVFLIAPFVLANNGHKLDIASQILFLGFGIFLLLVGGVVSIFTRLYHKTSADEAFVRTGYGGPRAVIDGGSIVISVVHNVLNVSLRTITFVVGRRRPA